MNTALTCETQGHLWNSIGYCVMCKVSKPAEPMSNLPPEEQLKRTIELNKLYGFHTLPELMELCESQARKIAELEHKFKNFHRLLCERFNYVHDEIDWERDQLSLIEWIAKQPQPETPSVHCDACKDTGQVPIGHSGQDSDGNAMMFEPCDQCPPEVSVKNDFADTKCPFTGRPYFMHMDHDELGNVPTYGGPFDSYTIPQPDEDGHLRSERYDHDLGGWIEGGEPTGLLVVSEDELVDQPSPPPTPIRPLITDIIDLVRNDGYAMTFQSMGQYRTALIRHIAAMFLDSKEFTPHEPEAVRCGAFDTATGEQCTLETDHAGVHSLKSDATLGLFCTVCGLNKEVCAVFESVNGVKCSGETTTVHQLGE